MVNEALKKLANLDSINRSAAVNAKSITHDATSNGEILNKNEALVRAQSNEPILDATHSSHDLVDPVKKSVSNAKYYEIEIKASNEDATPSLIPVDKLSSSFKINKPETNGSKSDQLSSDHDSALHNTFINLLKFKKASAKPQPQPPQEVDQKDISKDVNYSQDQYMVPERKAPPPKIAHEKSSKTTVSLRSQLTRTTITTTLAN